VIIKRTLRPHALKLHIYSRLFHSTRIRNPKRVKKHTWDSRYDTSRAHKVLRVTALAVLVPGLVLVLVVRPVVLVVIDMDVVVIVWWCRRRPWSSCSVPSRAEAVWSLFRTPSSEPILISGRRATPLFSVETISANAFRQLNARGN